MNTSYYKHCIVPQCKSTTIKTPNKLFIYIPNNKQIRRKWLEIAGRQDAHTLSTNSRMYFCEDHFDLPNDMINYAEYHIMGKVSQVRTKPGCIPKKFECQQDGRKGTCSDKKSQYMLKKQRMSIMAECLNKAEQSSTPNSTVEDTSNTISCIFIKSERIDDIKQENLNEIQEYDRYNLHSEFTVKEEPRESVQEPLEQKSNEESGHFICKYCDNRFDSVPRFMDHVNEHN